MEKYYWLNDLSRKFLNKGYLVNGQSAEDRIKEIAKHAENRLGIVGFGAKFEEYMSLGYYSLSTPVWCNYGNNRGLPISCFGSCIEDDMSSILFTQAEVGMMSKFGGGTSGYFGKLRHRGAPIKNNGESSGAAHFMQLFESLTDVVSQGSSRRGHFSPYLDVEHKDINEFLKIGTEGNAIQKLTHGVCITSHRMSEMVNGDEEKRELWATILKRRSEVGYPYIFFTDNANENKPECYADRKINHSNMCITGDTMVLTNEGYIQAWKLNFKGGELKLFNGQEVVESSEMKIRGENEDVYELTLENGMSIKATKEHGIPIMKGGKQHRVELGDLKIGDKVPIQTKKGIFGEKNNVGLAFLIGLYQSDGTQDSRYIHIDLWENDFDLIDKVKFILEQENIQFTGEYYCNTGDSTVKKARISINRTIHIDDLFVKGSVHNIIWQGTEQTCWSYIMGLLYADGTVGLSSGYNNPIHVAYIDINFRFLQQIQILMSNLGITSSIGLLHKGGKKLMPNHRGGKSYYNTKDCFRLSIGSKNSALEIEKNTGFLSRKGVSIEDRLYRDNRKKGYKVVSIEYIGKQMVYCPTIYNDEHIFVANGMKTYNCTEIMLPNNEDESFVCCLASINLLHWDKIKGTDAIETMIMFLDTVITEFCEKIDEMPDNQKYFMSRAKRFAERHRALGLGVIGWHSYLQNNMIAFESEKSLAITGEIFKHIKMCSYEASRELAKMFGPCEMCDDRRNTTLLAIAPTTSSAFILGQVSQSIEPYMSNYFIKDTAKVKTVFKNPYLEKLLDDMGMNNEMTWDSIREADGSVQHLDWLTQEEKDVFKTYSEISQDAIIEQAALRQKYIDQGQSLNLLLPSTISVKEINRLHLKAWNMGIKSLYYQHSFNKAQQVARKIKCVGCEA